MMRVEVSTEKRAAFTVTEREDEIELRIRSIRECLHFIGVILAARRLREEPLPDVERKDVRLTYGPISVTVA